jgi:hypothetical protein
MIAVPANVIPNCCWVSVSYTLDEPPEFIGTVQAGDSVPNYPNTKVQVQGTGKLLDEGWVGAGGNAGGVVLKALSYSVKKPNSGLTDSAGEPIGGGDAFLSGSLSPTFELVPDPAWGNGGLHVHYFGVDIGGESYVARLDGLTVHDPAPHLLDTRKTPKTALVYRSAENIRPKQLQQLSGIIEPDASLGPLAPEEATTLADGLGAGLGFSTEHLEGELI